MQILQGTKFGLALGLFCLVNLICVGVQHKSENNSVWTNEAQSVVEDFSARSDSPDVLFMGSSLIKAPLWYTDNAINPNVVRYTEHHKAEYFEQQAKLRGFNYTAFNMGIDGANASDMLLLFDKLISNSRKPQLVICAISPREFFATWFFPARATPTFKQLYEPADYLKTGYLYASDELDWLDGAWTQLLPLRRQNPLYKDALSHFYSSLLSSPHVAETAQKGADIEAALNADPGQIDLCANYTLTCMRTKINLYYNQKNCFKRFLELASKKQQAVLIVNLPLSPRAQSKIYKPLQTDYNAFLKELQKSGQVNVMDLQADSELCETENFMDAWHLNDKGGKIFIARLIEWLHKQKPCVHSAISSQP